MGRRGRNQAFNIVHIVGWYPNNEREYEGIFIKRMIESLPPDVGSEVYHVSIKAEGPKIAEWKPWSNIHRYRLQGYIKSWFLIEILTFFIVAYVFLGQINKGKTDQIHFHIAYPNLTYVKLLKWIAPAPIVIVEHWSAYYYKFGVENEEKLTRIKKIFKSGLGVIGVSKALLTSIENFSGECFPSAVVPNVVQTDIFNFDNVGISKQIFMISNWEFPKRPDIALKSFNLIIAEFPEFKLRIGGGGSLIEYLKGQSSSMEYIDNIEFLGSMSPTEIAQEMNAAALFMHISEYETFSVVCAEALCCGCPVLASSVGGIRELINSDNGKLVDKNDPNLISGLLLEMLRENEKFDRTEISRNATDLYNPERVGRAYYRAAKNLAII